LIKESHLRTISLLLLFVGTGFAQDGGLLTENPMAELKAAVDNVLDREGIPFSVEQDRQIILMMDERRRASEELFGDLQDFTAGPTQGQEADELRSAIEWMQGEFLARIDEYLTDAQAEAWEAALASGEFTAFGAGESGQESEGSDQTQYVRIHSDAYTAEDDSYRLGRNSNGNPSRTEVIQRGGTGAFHGNVEFLLRDDALNARNPFAGNKPDSQERQLSMDVSGPLIRRRLTSRFFFFQNEAENVDTVNATLPDGLFELGITRPTTNRSWASTNTLQIAESHTVDLAGEYSTQKGENQGVGGFALPERAYVSEGDAWNFSARHFSVLPGQSLFEARFGVDSQDQQTTPLADTVQINVLDAFNSGGAQNRTEVLNRNYEFSGMYTRTGERWILKSGVEGIHRTRRSLNRENFGGTFTFSSLDAFTAGEPVNYRVTEGEPLLEIGQTETAFFLQNDFELTPQFTLMTGLRYLLQSNLDDHNNLAPRVSFAWGLSPSMVLRGGAGIFHLTYGLNAREAQDRLNGTRQFETIIDNPSYPNPFVAGVIRETFPSSRVTDESLRAPYEVITGLQLEKTFLTNLFISAGYQWRTEMARHRLRDINAPLPVCIAGLPGDLSASDETAYIQGCRPDPASGVVLNLEPTGTEEEHIFRLNYRQRFSIFNVQARYTGNITLADSFPSNNPSIPADNYDLASDWARAPFPVHQVQATWNTELPLGVFLTGQFTGRSGQGYSILNGRDTNRDGRVTDRPEGVDRNSERGPAFYSFDFNISKAFFFANGSQNVNMFANMSNAFNRLNPGTPSGVLTSPNFGRSTSAQNPREIELGMRYQF
jgi:hypothetical protein